MKQLLEFVVAIAREAGESTLAYFGSRDLVVETKANHTPVTQADRFAEELLRCGEGQGNWHCQDDEIDANIIIFAQSACIAQNLSTKLMRWTCTRRPDIAGPSD